MRLITARITVYLPFRTSVEEVRAYSRIEKDLGNDRRLIIYPLQYVKPKQVIDSGYVNDYRKVVMDVVLPWTSHENDFSNREHQMPFIEIADEYLKSFLLRCKIKSGQYWWIPINLNINGMIGFEEELEFLDENGGILYRVQGSHGAACVFGAGINEKIWESIKNDMVRNVPPSIIDFYLEEARYPIFSGGTEMLIVNTAIAFEIFTKRFCEKYAQKNGKGSVLEKLKEREDNKKNHGFIVDYFKNIIPEITPDKRRLEDADKSAYQNIDYLFRTRNSVVHLGKTSFRDDGGTEHYVDHEEARQFFQASLKVMSWMRGIDVAIADELRWFN